MQSEAVILEQLTLDGKVNLMLLHNGEYTVYGDTLKRHFLLKTRPYHVILKLSLVG